ncbi:MAG: DUF3108 domain-containing protein [Arenimonas sp.]
MNRLLLALVLGLPSLALAATPAPYTARYEVLRNGERLGEATVMLKSLADGRSEFSSNTVGSEGLAGLTSATVEEKSLLRWRNGAPETVSWNYRQKVAWKTRERSLSVDAGARAIEHRDKDKRWSPPYQPGVLDRSAVTVALMNDLGAGRSGELRYPVPDKDEIKSWLFRTGASEHLDTPFGTQRALRVERIRDSGDGRSTTLWLAQDRNFVPLRILQKEASGESIDMRITSLH